MLKDFLAEYERYKVVGGNQRIVDELARLTKLGRADLEAALAPKAKPETTATVQTGEGRPRIETPGAKPVRIALQLLLEEPALAAKAEHLGQVAMLTQPGLDILLFGESLDEIVHRCIS